MRICAANASPIWLIKNRYSNTFWSSYTQSTTTQSLNQLQITHRAKTHLPVKHKTTTQRKEKAEKKLRFAFAVKWTELPKPLSSANTNLSNNLCLSLILCVCFVRAIPLYFLSLLCVQIVRRLNRYWTLANRTGRRLYDTIFFAGICEPYKCVIMCMCWYAASALISIAVGVIHNRTSWKALCVRAVSLWWCDICACARVYLHSVVVARKASSR